MSQEYTGSKAPLTVCYFGGYRPNYPRNFFYRQALIQHGFKVVECQVSVKPPNWLKALQLLARFWQGSHKAQVMFVAEFNHALVPLAWVLARLYHMTLLFDPGLSYYDEHVLRAKDVSPTSIYGRYLYWMENLAYHLCDLVIWFTPIDNEYFQNLFHIPSQRSTWLPPGLDRTVFAPTPLPPLTDRFIVHWDGNMSPTHGVDIILRAAALLTAHPQIHFEIIGKIHPSVQILAAELNLSNVTLPGVVPIEELQNSMQRAHLCLGVFRADDKLRRSLYTKEMQAMLAGRPLITAFGEAKDRLFKNNSDLLMISPEDPTALAIAIQRLAADDALRQHLAQQGAYAVATLCSIENAGGKLAQLIRQAYAQKHPTAML